MAKMGRPPLFDTVDDVFNRYTPDGFQGADGFERWCDERGYMMTWERFAVWCGADTQTLGVYMTNDGTRGEEYDKNTDFQTPLKRIKALLQAELVDNALRGAWRDATSIFCLKNNYGYTDQQQITADMSIKLDIGDNSELFE